MTPAEIERAILEKRAGFARDRRAELARDRLCINGASHGPATHGKKCAWCSAVHRLGIAAVIELDARGEAPARPPGYVLRSDDRTRAEGL